MTPDEGVAFSARLLSEGFIMPMIEAGFNAWDIAASLARAAGECCSDADQLKALQRKKKAFLPQSEFGMPASASGPALTPHRRSLSSKNSTTS